MFPFIQCHQTRGRATAGGDWKLDTSGSAAAAAGPAALLAEGVPAKAARHSSAARIGVTELDTSRDTL